MNWCPELGTVLANEEVVDGVSERGGHPVVRMNLKQWMLRISLYGDRLLDELADLSWPESIKLMQHAGSGAALVRRWISGWRRLLTASRHGRRGEHLLVSPCVLRRT